jgi:twitching motility protein PilT
MGMTATPSPFPPSPFPPPPAAGPAVPAGCPTTLEEIVRFGHERNHSDVHIGVGEAPRFRACGEIVTTGWPVTDRDTFNRYLREMLSPGELDAFLREKDYDGAHAFPFVRVRINLLEALQGPAMVLRLIPHRISGLEELKLPAVLRELCGRPKGLVLVTGPTGSGKSTTLAAMIDWINHSMARHILTIEDPVEFVHRSDQSLVRQREVGRHTRLFSKALRAALREDPDVILIGEIRDLETLSIALEASQTGHLVFGTLHTNSAVQTVERVMGMAPAHQQESLRRAIAESLLAVISQGLIRTGSGGRAPFHDILINTEACKDYILQGDLDAVELIMSRSGFDGMQTMNQGLQLLVEQGLASGEDAIALSPKPNELAMALRSSF